MAGRILVLDDEENYAEMLQDLLRGNNFRVDMATRPERAINQLEEIPYDLVISDYKMPVMDGADLLKRARELYPNLPFILVSGLMNTPELVKVANMSVTLVMEKPLDTEAFLKQVARFSEPMTDEEKTAQAKKTEVSDSEIDDVASCYPEEPRFFSAVSATGKRFMQNAWSIAQTSRDLFILEPFGGDAELGAKDISAWRGNSDLPVASFVLPDSNEEAILELRGILSEQEQSNTVCIRLTAASQIAQAHELTESAIKELEGAANMLLIYVLESNETAPYLDEVGPRGIVLPALNERASDVAAYARRFARMASDRSGKKNCSEFTPEAAFLILSHNWPRGYKEVQEAVMQAVKSTENDEAISADLLQKALGIEAVQIPRPDSRLLALMSTAQRCYFEKVMSGSGVSAAELGRKLELGDAVQTRDELINMPLVKSELGKL
jgi:DNA-binding NtrC family response regulator